MWKAYMGFVGLSLIMVLLVGIGVGTPSLFPMLQSLGVFSSRCMPETTECLEQLHMLSTVTSFSLTFLNMLGLPAGILADFFGIRLCAIVSIVVWIFGLSIMGITPHLGWFWATGLCLMQIGSIFLYFAMIGEYPKSLGFTSALPVTVLNGFWDLGAITFSVFRELYLRSTVKPTMFYIFAIYGVAIGAPSFLFLARSFPPDCQQQKYSWEKLGRELKMLKDAISTPVFISLVSTGTCAIVYGYFFLPTVQQYILWKGGSLEEAVYYNNVCGLLLALLGSGSSVFLGLYIRYDNRATLVIANLIQALLALGLLILTLVPMSLKAQYVAFGIFVIWRMNTFCIASSALSAMFGPEMTGRVAGAIFSIPGLLGVLTDRFAISWASTNPDVAFPILHCFGCGFSVLAALSLAIVATVDLDQQCHCISFARKQEGRREAEVEKLLRPVREP